MEYLLKIEFKVNDLRFSEGHVRSINELFPNKFSSITTYLGVLAPPKSPKINNLNLPHK